MSVTLGEDIAEYCRTSRCVVRDGKFSCNGTAVKYSTSLIRRRDISETMRQSTIKQSWLHSAQSARDSDFLGMQLFPTTDRFQNGLKISGSTVTCSPFSTLQLNFPSCTTQWDVRYYSAMSPPKVYLKYGRFCSAILYNTVIFLFTHKYFGRQTQKKKKK